MSHDGNDTCDICGIERDKSDRWFLLLEDRWQDTLKILRWGSQLAPEFGTQRLCCSAHLQQVVCSGCWLAAWRMFQLACPSRIYQPPRAIHYCRILPVSQR